MTNKRYICFFVALKKMAYKITTFGFKTSQIFMVSWRWSSEIGICYFFLFLSLKQTINIGNYNKKHLLNCILKFLKQWLAKILE